MADACRPLGFVVFDISDGFSNDFACWYVVFLVNLGPWALERSDLTQSGGSGGRQPPSGLKKLKMLEKIENGCEGSATT